MCPCKMCFTGVSGALSGGEERPAEKKSQESVCCVRFPRTLLSVDTGADQAG